MTNDPKITVTYQFLSEALTFAAAANGDIEDNQFFEVTGVNQGNDTEFTVDAVLYESVDTSEERTLN